MTKITYEDVKPLVESLKEAARVVVIAIIPLLIEQLSAGEIQWKSIGVVAGITLLRFVDKYLHLVGKVEDDKILTGGLVRF